MKKLIFLFIIIFGISSCDDFHTYNNGDLEGYWRLIEIDSLNNSGKQDLKDKLIFWSIQSKLLGLNNRETGAGFFMLQEHPGDSLHIWQPYRHNWHTDTAITDLKQLYPFGISSTDESFLIEHVDNSNMVLKSEQVRLLFEKY